MLLIDEDLYDVYYYGALVSREPLPDPELASIIRYACREKDGAVEYLAPDSVAWRWVAITREEALTTPIAGPQGMVTHRKSNGRWSLHSAGSTDEQISSGQAPPLAWGGSDWDDSLNTWARPDLDDYAAAYQSNRLRVFIHGLILRKLWLFRKWLLEAVKSRSNTR